MTTRLSSPRLSLSLLLSLTLSSCGGDGGSIIPGTDDNDPSAQTPVFSLSGRLSIASGIVTDSDLNDIAATYASNDDPAKPQQLNNRGSVQGFVSSVKTGGNPEYERFADSADQDDYFRAALQKGQILRLQVADFDADNPQLNDLELGLSSLDNNGAWNPGSPLQMTSSYNAIEELVVAEDGNYLINVTAVSGISKYVLQILPASNTASAHPVDDFVAGEIIVKARSGHTLSAQVRSAGLSTVLSPAALNTLSSTATVTDSDKPQLLSIRRNTALLNSGSTDADPLLAFSPTLYNKRKTLMDIKRLRQQEGIEYAEPNYIRRKAQATPNDPAYRYQWHYPAINLPQAWNLSQGDDVIVAVIDTGVFLAHPDLSGQLTDGYDFVSNPDSARDGNGLDSNPDDPGDSPLPGASSWHGTHVAGTIAALTNNAIGGAGVAPNAKIMPLRALGKNNGSSYDIIQAVRYAARLSNDSNTLPAQKADIINLSLGGYSSSAAEQALYSELRDAGVIVVAAAGNDTSSVPFFPAAYPEVISVSATNYQGAPASYSNFGSSISVAAPGGELSNDDNLDGQKDGVLSTVANDSSGTRQPGYSLFEGTSMASPHVAGVIALMKAVHPSLSAADVGLLLQSCAITSKANNCNRDNQLGYGQIDAYRAVSEALRLEGGGTLPPRPVTLQSVPAELVFGAGNSLGFILSNAGDEEAVALSVSDNTDWLSITPGTTDSKNFGSYNASIDRTGLGDGYYSATITVSAGSYSLSIPVYMQNGVISSNNAMTQQYVLLEDADCIAAGRDNSECTRSIYARADGRYYFYSIPPGRYALLAGSDIDADNRLCQTGETCGVYPGSGTPQIIELNTNRSGMNFTVSLNSNPGSSLNSQRILSRPPAAPAEAGKSTAP
ncbi:MAG: peptidase S8 [Thalassolituus sp. CG17_big_fil_post_rev_8_21_14_2_50_53_8]|nr:MAG: peptidase S8 [Thalassolituus sp. CG17_big_fil_post_rev_8_21_14_2_50_53_8]